jgi:glycosyltransferase involved in cell wall biosynthesis
MPVLYPFRLYKNMAYHAEKLHKRIKFDAIFATSPPEMTLKIADKISRINHIPWVADLRDTLDQFKDMNRIVSLFRVRQEVAVCQSANALITVSFPLAAKLASRYQIPVHVVHNGFDPDDFPSKVDSSSEYFKIVYCGLIYGGRDPSPLLDALDFIIRKKKRRISRMRVTFYGDSATKLHKYIQGRPSARLTEAKGRLPFTEILKVEKEASVLLLLSHPADKGIMTYKVFEYLGAKRPILSIPSDKGVIDKLLQETGAGISKNSPEEIAEIIISWYDEWKRTGTIRYGGRPEKIARYTRISQAKKLARILDDISVKS